MVDPGAASRVAFPNAKINLGLQVLGKRPDGYHALDSLFVPIPWCDALELTTPGTREGCTLHLHGQPVAGASEDNLVSKAYRMLQEAHGLPAVDVHLIKAIPSGAGLGGGSADGAFMLRALNDHFQLGLTVNDLEQHAAELGSDCPFFIRNQPARVTGRGEGLSPLPLALGGWHIALLNPSIHIPTAEAFQWVTPNADRPGLEGWAGTGPESWVGHLRNDFTDPVVKRHPEIAEALHLLRKQGATFADMSGSGSTVFGFFKEDSEGITALTSLEMPAHWTCWTGQFPD